MKMLTDERLKVGADLAAYLAAGGGRGLEAALAAPASIIASIEAAGLRGLGGAGFPTHRKWSAVAAEAGPRKWVICNGNEDEPGTFKDRFLLVETPHQVIEGALIAALAVGSSNVVLYVNPRSKRRSQSFASPLAHGWRHPLVGASPMRSANRLPCGSPRAAGSTSAGRKRPLSHPSMAVSLPFAQAALSGAARRGEQSDAGEQRRDPGACGPYPGQGRGLVSRPGAQRGMRNKAVFPLGGRASSRSARIADGHALTGSGVQSGRRRSWRPRLQGRLHGRPVEHASHRRGPRRSDGFRSSAGAGLQARGPAP